MFASPCEALGRAFQQRRLAFLVNVMICSVIRFGEHHVTVCDGDMWDRHLPLPQADAQSKQQQEAAIEQLLQELDIDLLVLAR